MNYIERYWRDAKPEDAIKDPPMVARFRSNNAEWSIETLNGYNRKLRAPWGGDEWWYYHCQVYDAPDPGEGWRLIDPDKDDYRQDGIQFWNQDKNTWSDRLVCEGRAFLTDTFYRIRITPTVTYVPFTWEDREQLRGRWIRDGENLELLASAMHRNSSGVFYAEGRSAKVLLDRFIFVDTGEPVGRKVME